MLHLSIREPEGNARLVVSDVPPWFLCIAAYHWHWPLWKWYQQIMTWWWKRLETYPCVEISIDQATRQQIDTTLWKHEPEKKNDKA